jgi:cobalt-precorrin 5A hydrolase
MTGRIAIGIGCRKGCTGENITSLVRHAVALVAAARTPPDAMDIFAKASLFTSEDKRREPGLAEAAAALGLKLVPLPRAALEAAAPRCETRSRRVQALLGLPSLAEAAALAGAGEGSRLALARISEGGASCAVALPSEIAP